MEEEVQAYVGAVSSFPHLIKELKGRNKILQKILGRPDGATIRCQESLAPFLGFLVSLVKR